jgi:hypothetical protein
MNKRWVITDVHLNVMNGMVSVSAGGTADGITFMLENVEDASNYIVGHELLVTSSPILGL